MAVSYFHISNGILATVISKYHLLLVTYYFKYWLSMGIIFAYTKNSNDTFP